MRKLILLSALALASCGGGQQANNAAVSEESGAGDVTAVNDTTAIDAATGEAANMAADVNYTFNEEATNESGNKSSNKSEPAFEPDEPGTPNNVTE
ncbi:MAG TPA: hypothetical protein VNS53_07275 [Sphingomicrobium sp.]|jgi:hypothetical protein|nr:hypothetical protein [Sphingomicrobium sp.]